jgi:chromosomal replication initiation ATPase DnaA
VDNVKRKRIEKSLLQLQDSLIRCLGMVQEEIIEEASPKNWHKILKSVGDLYNLTPAEIKARDQSASRVMARQVCHVMLRKLTPMSYPEIARVTGLIDHTTVLHSIRKIESMRRANPQFDEKLRELEASLAV